MSVDADGPTSHGSVAASEAAAADGIYNFGPITHPNLYPANLLPDQPNPGAPTYSRGHTVITPVESFEASWDQGKTWFPCTKIGLCLAADRDQATAGGVACDTDSNSDSDSEQDQRFAISADAPFDGKILEYKIHPCNWIRMANTERF